MIASAPMLAPANTTAPAPTLDARAELAARPTSPRARGVRAPGAGACRAPRGPRSTQPSPIDRAVVDDDAAPKLTPLADLHALAEQRLRAAARRVARSQPHDVGGAGRAA